MDNKTAAELLEQIQQEKQSEFKGLANWIPNLPVSDRGLQQAVAAKQNNQLQSKSQAQVIKALLAAGGIGMALRGASGLGRLFSENKPVPSRTVDMPVMYPNQPEDEDEKRAFGDNAEATSPYGLDWYIPSMLAGSSLAAYGGWKGMDAIMDKQRRRKTEEDLESAKKDYEQALLGSYKRASDESSLDDILDAAFDAYEKQAKDPTWWSRWGAENVPGAAKGLATTYGLGMGGLGYMVVNSIMKKNSKRALLEKAMKERARRQALMQPAELYAVPTPQTLPKIEEEEEVQ